MSDLLQHWRDVASAFLADAAQRRVAVAGVVGVLALAGGAVFFTSTRAAPVELTLPRANAAATTGSVPDLPEDGAGGAESGRPVAHAAGAVVRPGIYPLPSGARVADLLAAAGGPTADADLDAINLAAKVEDGARIYVPRRGEAVPAEVAAAGEGTAGTAAIVNLNSASLAELDSLPGVGPATAQAILDYRRQHGRFRSIDQLLEVRGIGEAKLRQIRPRVRV
jgi:competence protein ComEA